ncbi:recombinase family protein [Bacillus cytotoxicus]|uniref:Recombinase family protein n=1 Tax=Bacillus cytotoxicus TaxID=580165 RepID=A0ACC6A2N2_9BACI|nr:recombinase family protein [Bacillus cytotoxicus]
MRKHYIHFLFLLMFICLISSCSKANKAAKEVCKTTEECVKTGDASLSEINKNMQGISELETYTEVENKEELAAYEEQGKDDERYFFLASYYIDNNELVDPYFENLDKKRLQKVFANDKEAREEISAFHEDTDYHQTLWDMYSVLIPAKYRENIKEFDIVSDGYDNIVAHVMQNEDNPEEWVLSLDALDSNVYINEVMKTLIHETAHVLTLNKTQIPVDKKYVKAVTEEKDISAYESKCTTLFLTEGCSKKESYVNQFYEQFWKPLESEWKEKKVETDLEAQMQFFKEHEDKFVSEYATTNVAEDIADTFTAFILQDSNKVKESKEGKYQKIAFFYQFPELVKMRAEVLAGLQQISEEVEEA